MTRFQLNLFILIHFSSSFINCEKTGYNGPEQDDFENARPCPLYRVGPELRIAATVLSNTGKSAHFGILTGAQVTASPRTFTIPDDRFSWLTKHYPAATQRPPVVILVVTPALHQLDEAALNDEVVQQLRDSDILLIVIDLSDLPPPTLAQSVRDVSRILKTHTMASKPTVYAVSTGSIAYENASSSRAFTDARSMIRSHDKQAVVLPFSGALQENREQTVLAEVDQLSSSTSIIAKTIEKCRIMYFFTANEDLVAAWAVPVGTTIGGAIKLLNVSIPPSGKVGIAGMREVIEAGSLSPAFGVIRHLRIDDELEDGDLVLVTPHILSEEVTMTPSSLRIPSPPEPTVGAGGNVQSSGYAAPLVMGLLFFTLLVVTVAVLSSKKRRNRLLSYADTCLRRLSSNNDGREALLQGATYEAVTETVNFR